LKFQGGGDGITNFFNRGIKKLSGNDKGDED